MNAGAQSSDISRRLESWYGRDAGAQLHAALQQRLGPLLDRSFGYHALQLGPLPALDLIADSPINHRIRACAHPHGGTTLRCYGDELPLESDSVDVLVAFHALEFEPRPHASLREMQRVLRPFGHLVVIGFNPHSLLGLGLRLRGLRRDGLWGRHQPVSPGRLVDWLHLVDCELEDLHHLYPIPLLGSGGLRRAIGRFDDWAMRRRLPGGGIYLAHAVKQRTAMRPLRERQLLQPALPRLSLVGSPQAARRRDRAA